MAIRRLARTVAPATTLLVLITSARVAAYDWPAESGQAEIKQRLDEAEARDGDLEARDSELEERSDELEQRNDDLEARLEEMQHELNLRDPAWRARTLQRCHHLGQMESRPLCARLYREQTWSEWLAASWRKSRVKAQPKAPPPANVIARPVPPKPVAVAVAAPTAAPSPAGVQESDSSVTIEKPDGTRVRLVYDQNGALRRSERLD